MNNHENITYRFLTKKDFKIYKEHVQEITTNKKFTETDKTRELEKVSFENFIGDKTQIFGAFDNYKLIISQSAFFPDDINYWYAGMLISNISNKSLSKHKITHYIFGQILYNLVEYGEKLGYLGFYSRRKVADQIAVDKIYNEFQQDNTFYGRYEVLWDQIYQSPCNCKNKLHLYFKDYIENSNSTSVVVLNNLRSQYRKEILLRK